ncbi:MAG: amino acid permease [Actinobacteria bacterium]|jgi:amino acid transporter|nr:MAG: amino acid permease [Actinomycetota bacterium]
MGDTSSSKGGSQPKGKISLAAAVAIGIGGMVGAGVFSVLGVAAESAKNALWLSFAIGGIITLFSTYSYSKLGVKYPSAGGAVEFLVRGFGDNVLSGGINIYLWIGYVIAIALYAMGFSSYFATFFTANPSTLFLRGVAVAVVLLFTLVNFLGAQYVGRSETVIVAIKIAILVLFAGVGLFFVKGQNLSPSGWPGIGGILAGTGVLFIGYEGFGLVTNTAGDMKDPEKMLPRALYTSLFLVVLIYLAVSITVSGNLTTTQIAASRDYALAEAAKPFLGNFGFKLIAIAALFSTASAINATLFGGANASYIIAKRGELPKVFDRTAWKGSTDGLFITAGLVVAFVLLFDLSGIAMMGSGAFLLIYGVVNIGHLRIAGKTGANRAMVAVAVALCLGMFVLLSVDMFRESKPSFIAMFALLAAAFLAEWAYRRFTGRRLHALSRSDDGNSSTPAALSPDAVRKQAPS